MKHIAQKIVLAAGTLSLSTLAIAHPDHALANSASITDALIAGLIHPVSGLDHIVVAMGMGLVFARQKKVGMGVLVSSLILGFVLIKGLGWTISSSIIESAILASVVVTAVVVLAQSSQLATDHQIGFFALIAGSLFGLTLFHGMAHAVEMPVNSVTEGFAVGMLATMSALFAMGAGVMKWIKAQATQDTSKQWLAWLPSVLTSFGAMLVWFNA